MTTTVDGEIGFFWFRFGRPVTRNATCRPRPGRQHMRNCTMIGNQLFQDILSYSLPLIGCPESSSDDDIHVATGVSQHPHELCRG